MKRDRTGLVYRPADKVILDESKGAYGKLPIGKDDVVLDLGAHIGVTSRLALSMGAARVVAVEADPQNIVLLRTNVRSSRATILYGAVGPTVGRTDFYPNRDRTFLGSRIGSGRKVRVPMFSLAGLLSTYRPTVVKCDIEFGEYDLPELRSLPAHVRVLAMEVHVRYAGILTADQSNDEIRQRRRDAVGLIDDVLAQGFREVRRKDKQAKAGTPIEDDTGLPPMTKAIDAIWERA